MSAEYIQFPVPKQFVPQVTALVAHLMEGADPREADPASKGAVGLGTDAGIVHADGVVWTHEMFERLRADERLSQARVLRILDTLPIGKDAALPLEACAGLAEMTDDQFRHALGWLTKFTNKHPDLWSEPTWPLGYQKGYNPQRPGIFYYWMSDEQAEAWGR